MIIYGLDLSIANTGVAIYDTEKEEVLELLSIPTNSKDQHGVRLRQIRNKLLSLYEKYGSGVVVIERGFTRFNKATQVLYRVHGVANELFADESQTYYPPGTIKKAMTGDGHASKDAVKKEVKKYFDINDEKINDDMSDALAVIATHIISNTDKKAM